MMDKLKEEDHWLVGGVQWWQLLLSLVGIVVSIAIPVTSGFLNDRDRVRTLEVQHDYGVQRNNRQDSEIEQLRNIASANQIAIGQMNARLDSMVSQLSSINAHLEKSGIQSTIVPAPLRFDGKNYGR